MKDALTSAVIIELIAAESTTSSIRASVPESAGNIKTALATQVIGPKNSETRLLQLALQIFNASKIICWWHYF